MGKETLLFKVTGMTCSHCAATVEQAAREITGVESAQVDLAKGLVTVIGSNVDSGKIIETINSSGYSAQLI